VGVLVGEATRAAVPDMLCREVDRIKVKGKDEAITVYEPLGLAAELDSALQEELRLWQQVLRAYRARNWDTAETGLAQLRRAYPQRALYAVYEEQVQRARQAPMTAPWEPVTVFDEK
jgi:adenylate cyclase